MTFRSMTLLGGTLLLLTCRPGGNENDLVAGAERLQARACISRSTACHLSIPSGSLNSCSGRCGLQKGETCAGSGDLMLAAGAVTTDRPELGAGGFDSHRGRPAATTLPGSYAPPVAATAPAPALPATPEPSVPAVSAQAARAEGLLPKPPAPADDFQRCRAKALRGDFGVLKPWQYEAYLRAEGVTVRPGRLWVTHYWPAEGRQSQVDCRGNRCTSTTAACNALGYGTVVWLSNPCGLRVIRDRGARRNDRQARRYKADFWLDRWSPGPKGNYMSEYAVLGGPR